MTHASTRPRRNPWIALVCATALIALAAVGITSASASAVHAAAAPSLSNVTILPAQPTKGKGFKVSFKTKAGGTYEVFYSTTNMGDLLQSGNTKTGTITTKRVGKTLRAGKYSLGVRVTVGSKQKTIRKTLVIKK